MASILLVSTRIDADSRLGTFFAATGLLAVFELAAFEDWT